MMSEGIDLFAIFSKRVGFTVDEDKRTAVQRND